MKKNDFLTPLLSEYSSPTKSLLDQWRDSSLNAPKEPRLSDTVKREMNPQPTKDIFDDLEKHKEPTTPPLAPMNQKYIINNKNFSQLIDIADAHKFKIEMVCDKTIELEDNQISIKKEISEFKKSALASKYFDWKSFSCGVMTLAILLFFTYLKFG